MEGTALRPSGPAWLARPTSTIASDEASRRSDRGGVEAQWMASMLMAHRQRPRPRPRLPIARRPEASRGIRARSRAIREWARGEGIGVSAVSRTGHAWEAILAYQDAFLAGQGKRSSRPSGH